MRKAYVHLREGYKYYSGVSPLGRIMCIGPGTLTELLGNCREFIDNKSIKITDIDLSIIACNGVLRSNFLNPEKALCRY